MALNNEYLHYYKLKYASNFGNFEKYAFKYHDIDYSKDKGVMSTVYRKHEPKMSDYPMI